MFLLRNTYGIGEIIDGITNEYNCAIENHSSFHSAHEGYAIILEELDELKQEVFKKSKERDVNKMRSEATQVAAMAIRFIYDICDVEERRLV